MVLPKALGEACGPCHIALVPAPYTMARSEFQIISCAASDSNRIAHVGSGVTPDHLTGSKPVLDRYCFTFNFGHATGASNNLVSRDRTRTEASPRSPISRARL